MKPLVVPPLAVEFVESLADNAEETLVRWMQANKLPTESWQLAAAVGSLTYYAGLVSTGQHEEAARFGIDEVVHKAINNIAALGGVFHGAGLVSIARKSLPAFQEVDPDLHAPQTARFVELISQLDDAGLAEVEAEMRAQLATRGWSERTPITPKGGGAK